MTPSSTSGLAAEAQSTSAPLPRAAHRLDSLFKPRSVAVVGASERNAYSNNAVRALERIGFKGKLHYVNPRGSAYGHKAAVDCRSLGEEVDAAYLCVPYAALLDVVGDAIEGGIRNLMIVSAGFAEVGVEGERRQAKLKSLCESAGARALGPNALGYVNFVDHAALGGIPVLDQHVRGNIGLVSNSGAVAAFLAMYGANHGVGFTHLIATGNEMNVTSSDCIDYLVGIPEVEAIALFIETVKDPETFVAAVLRARAARKPVVAIKIGASQGTAAIAAAHTSAVVGDDRVFDAACERLGVVRVRTMEDLVITAATLAATGPIERPGVALITTSGGVAELVSDDGPYAGVSLPQFSGETREQLGKALSDLSQTHNPLDLTGAAVRDESLWTTATSIVSRDPSIGLTLVALDMPSTAEPAMPGTLETIGQTPKHSAGPVLVMANYEQDVNAFGRAYQRRYGFPVTLPGVGRGMTAVGKLAWWSERVRQPATAPLITTGPATAPRPRDERETLAHLAAHGVPVVPTLVARSGAEAASAAREIGGRVAMKVLSPDIAHKSDVGGVILNLESPEAVERAYGEMMRSLETRAAGKQVDGVILAPMRTGGLELLAGVARDPQWGLVLALGLGGVFVEVLDDVVLSLLPSDPSDLVRRLRSLKAAKLFDGYRGGPTADLEAVAVVAAHIGEAAAALGPDLSALEINPLLVSGDQIEALDALATWTS